ncbi:MAG: hypothetical protein HQ471_08450 [Flavobacteriales bacterium]|jgi:hypothetical protein|nr:hypothetical protein [Flavobacteriales bacterium]
MTESTLSSLHLKDFVEIFILMLGAFLIGYGFAYYYFKQKLENAKSGYGAHTFNDSLEKVTEGEIKATKTFERGGFEVVDPNLEEIEFFVKEDENEKTISKKKTKDSDTSS